MSLRTVEAVRGVCRVIFESVRPDSEPLALSVESVKNGRRNHDRHNPRSPQQDAAVQVADQLRHPHGLVVVHRERGQHHVAVLAARVRHAGERSQDLLEQFPVRRLGEVARLER